MDPDKSAQLSQTENQSVDTFWSTGSSKLKDPLMGTDINYEQMIRNCSEDIPQLSVIRQDLILQAQIEKRLTELSEVNKTATK